jgi:hypothetical protein
VPTPLDYRTPQPKRRWPIVHAPPDWRRRLIVAAIACPIVFLLTLEAARRSQASVIAYNETGMTVYDIRFMQKAIDDYTRTTGHAPSTLSEVPEIQKRAAQEPGFLTDRWNTPYLLQTINGKPVVLSYGPDRCPGGEGLNADILGTNPARPPPTMLQFVHATNLAPVLIICLGNALLTFAIAFAGNDDTRLHPYGLFALVLRLAITATLAILVGGIIAIVHAPSGH